MKKYSIIYRDDKGIKRLEFISADNIADATDKANLLAKFHHWQTFTVDIVKNIEIMSDDERENYLKYLKGK